MRSSTEPTDTLGPLPSEHTEPGRVVPARPPVGRQASEHVWEVDGRYETRGYPRDPHPPTKEGRLSSQAPLALQGLTVSGAWVDELQKAQLVPAAADTPAGRHRLTPPFVNPLGR